MFTSSEDLYNFYQMIEGLDFAYRLRFDTINETLPKENQITFEKFMELMPKDIMNKYQNVKQKEANGIFEPFF